MDEFIQNKRIHDLLLELLRVDRIPDKCAWGTTWESIHLPEEYEKPPKEEFETKLQELVDAQPWKELRTERNRRLAEVDWVFSTDYQIEHKKRSEWLAYRQALRDLPSTTNDPTNPSWPEKPSIPTGTTLDVKLENIETLKHQNTSLGSKITSLEKKLTDLELSLIELRRRVGA
jgi:hypothetical protein